MNHNNQYYEFYFKLAYTNKIKKYFVQPNISIDQFINDIKMRARSDFDLKNNEEIEIVEVGLYNNINGYDAELAPAIQSSNMLLSNLYGNHKNMSFYIRKITNFTNLTLDIPESSDIENNIGMYVPRPTHQYVGYENV